MSVTQVSARSGVIAVTAPRGSCLPEESADPRRGLLTDSSSDTRPSDSALCTSPPPHTPLRSLKPHPIPRAD